MTFTAQRLVAPGTPLVEASVAVPDLFRRDVLMEVSACGVCRTDLHIVDGELSAPRLPVTPGHEIVGRVIARGDGVTRFRVGDRIGVPWLGGTCGVCAYCEAGRENLCDTPVFTGLTRDGGYAELAVADENYAFALPSTLDDEHAAPLLCAGLIGYRALKLAGDGQNLGLYGFGAAAHIVAQLASGLGREVFAFTRPGDADAQAFARKLGCAWAGGSDENPPVALDAALIFAPVGALVPAALAATRKGATVVCAGIHMSEIPGFPYRLLWGERIVRSVANLTRADGDEFFAMIERIPVRTEVTPYPLSSANRALDDLRRGAFNGAAVLRPR